MKFARYLEETQIPEWKKAYIDFKGLKKRIAAIRKSRQGGGGDALRSPDLPHRTESQRAVSDRAWGQSHGSLGPSVRSQQELPHAITSRRPDADHPDREKHRTSVPNQPSRSGSEVALSRTSSRDDHATERPSFPRLFAARPRYNRTPIQPSTTIESLYASLDSQEKSFFTYLDHELQKVDSFYNEREGEAINKLSTLKDQLRELQQHRRVFHEARDEPWALFPRALGEALGMSGGQTEEPKDLGVKNGGKNNEKSNGNDSNGKQTEASRDNSPLDIARDPAEYQHARRKLKKAFQEFYRGLELLNDYRVLNLTGFRKALKKYEKFTRRPAQDLYFREKIQPCRFSYSATMVDSMRDVEVIFASRFEHGDRKQALRRLKAPFIHKSHYFSTFRAGIYMGLAIPAVVGGIYRSFQPETRQQIPEWGPLLETYVTLFIPVIFSVLIGINLLVWSRSRINFAFIFELDVRSAIDSQEYFELPAIMFATLSYAFGLSFFAIGSRNVAPTTWPIIWVGVAVAIMANPLNILSRSSRYWFIKNASRLLIPGFRRVEFTGFWMGDQFCSLSYSLGHLFTLACAYSNHWNNVFGRCGSSMHWEAPFVLVSLPYLVRMVQSVRRWYDSRSPTHLINGGKYLSSVVGYTFYYVWRSRGSPRDSIFVLYCLFATFSSSYLTIWDLTMDWSILKLHGPHKPLRTERVYTNNSYMYYFAIISNIIIRFIWVIYTPSPPSGGLNSRVRAPIAAILEMLRRFQWNFFRLENEQIGNADQYRATREVPLPYSTRQEGGEDDGEDSDIGEEETIPNKPTRVYRNQRSLRISRRSHHDKSADDGQGDMEAVTKRTSRVSDS